MSVEPVTICPKQLKRAQQFYARLAYLETLLITDLLISDYLEADLVRESRPLTSAENERAPATTPTLRARRLLRGAGQWRQMARGLYLAAFCEV